MRSRSSSASPAATSDHSSRPGIARMLTRRAVSLFYRARNCIQNSKKFAHARARYVRNARNSAGMIIANPTRMMRLRLRSTVVVATLVLFGVSAIFTDEAPQAADAPGPYVLTDLGTLGGLSAEALDINDAGEIVGASTNSALRSHAFVWRDGTMIDLGTIGGNHSQATAQSPTGRVVGRSQTATTKYHATLWAGGTTTDLTPSS